MILFKMKCGSNAGAIYELEKYLGDRMLLLKDLAGNLFTMPENACELVKKEETEMKVMALTNGFMRTKGEWYTVREELESCYIIEAGKMLICVLKSDFITEFDFKHQQAVKQALNTKYAYQDTDNLKIDVIAIDIKKVNALNKDLKNLLYALLGEVKA